MSDALRHLKDSFEDPQADGRPLALWLWNGDLHEAQIGRQIREFAAKGMGGVVVRASLGLRTPYLDTRWWETIGYAVRAARDSGISIWIGDDYRTPSGSAGDPGSTDGPAASRVLALGPEHRGKTLTRSVVDVTGPVEVQLEGRYPAGDPLTHVAGRVDSKHGLDPKSLTELTDSLTWACPEGHWKIFSFAVRPVDGRVDYLRTETVARFVETTYEPYVERFGNDIAGFSFASPHLTSDPIPWTESLPAQFAELKGYDLLPLLPMLVVRAGPETTKLRCDFYDTLATLYTDAWFAQISSWCEARGVTWTGHTEEHLAAHPARQADYFRTMRQVSLPASDMHGFRNSRPRNVQPAEIKLAVSVAALTKRPRVAVQAFGGSGWSTTLDDVRRGLNRLAILGVDLPVIQSFHYSMDRAESADDWPNTFFTQNPYWRHFGELTNYAARLASLVHHSRAATSIGVLAPLTSVWANTADGRPNTRAQEVSDAFEALVDGLFDRRIDVHVVDDTFVVSSKLQGGLLHEGHVTIDTLVVPPAPVISRPVASRLAAFVKAGGRLVWTGEVPSASSETGQGDGSLTRIVSPLNAPATSAKQGAVLGSGRVYALTADSPKWLDDVASRLSTPSSLASDTKGIVLTTRYTDGGGLVLLANEKSDESLVTITTTVKGAAEIWDPETGTRTPLSVTGSGKRRTAEIKIPGHGALAVIFDESSRPSRAAPKSRARRRKWNDLGDDWQFAIESGTPTGQGTVRRAELPVMHVRDLSLGAGRLEKLRDPAYDDSGWPEMWLTAADASTVGNWRASWITGVRKPQDWVMRPDSGTHDRLRFTKSITFNDPPIKAWATFVGVEHATVYMNGTVLGESEDWTSPVTYNIMPYLRLGENTIVADVSSNSRTPVSLLFESQIDLRSGESLVVVSDRTWDVDAPPGEMWTGTGFSRDVPIATWERGKPPVQPWGHMVLLGEPVKFPRTLMYRQRLPVGCVGIGIPYIKGIHKVFVDVRERTPDIHGIYNITTGGVISVEIDATDFSSGILAPLTLFTRPTTIKLAPWGDLGYHWYSGSAIYERTFELTKGEAETTVTLDLGDVRYHAEVIVNNRPIGARVWPPYRFNISDAVNPGANTVRVRVSNLAANEMRWRRDEARMSDPWHRYWHEDNIEQDRLGSGLLGPVKVQFQPREH